MLCSLIMWHNGIIFHNLFHKHHDNSKNKLNLLQIMFQYQNLSELSVLNYNKS